MGTFIFLVYLENEGRKEEGGSWTGSWLFSEVNVPSSFFLLVPQQFVEFNVGAFSFSPGLAVLVNYFPSQITLFG